MKETIKITEVYWEPLALFQKVNDKSLSQRALLGYMRDEGYLRDPIYGGAFSLLMEFEKYVGIPIITTEIDEETANKILSIANKAKRGRWDAYALSQTEIRDAVCRAENERNKQRGGKRK